MTVIGKLLKEMIEVLYGLETSKNVRYNESNELHNMDLDILLSPYTEEFPLPYKFKRYFTSEINTHLSKEERQEKVIVKYIGNWKVIFVNNGFDNYKFMDVEELK